MYVSHRMRCSQHSTVCRLPCFRHTRYAEGRGGVVAAMTYMRGNVCSLKDGTGQSRLCHGTVRLMADESHLCWHHAVDFTTCRLFPLYVIAHVTDNI